MDDSMQTDDGAQGANKEVTALSVLQKIHQQNEKIKSLQELNYRWQLQHHSNIKKIIMALNRLGEIVHEKSQLPTFRLEVVENPALYQVK